MKKSISILVFGIILFNSSISNAQVNSTVNGNDVLTGGVCAVAGYMAGSIVTASISPSGPAAIVAGVFVGGAVGVACTNYYSQGANGAASSSNGNSTGGSTAGQGNGKLKTIAKQSAVQRQKD